jgi:MYXO-CTERM domain-containing protein
MNTAQALSQGRTNATQLAAAITTGVFALMLATSGALYLIGPAPVVAGIHRLGYPDYFRQLLGVAKIAGAAVLVFPSLRALREWAYAGFTFNLIAAIASHVLSGDAAHAGPAVVALALLAVSYSLRRRIRQEEKLPASVR